MSMPFVLYSQILLSLSMFVACCLIYVILEPFRICNKASKRKDTTIPKWVFLLSHIPNQNETFTLKKYELIKYSIDGIVCELREENQWREKKLILIVRWSMCVVFFSLPFFTIPLWFFSVVSSIHHVSVLYASWLKAWPTYIRALVNFVYSIALI